MALFLVACVKRQKFIMTNHYCLYLCLVVGTWWLCFGNLCFKIGEKKGGLSLQSQITKTDNNKILKYKIGKFI